ncbi:T9SS type A sorting domain-containing protein [Chishuiella changwenlii]|uniref:T9SS type A sorting domain-containing protein n=1 Tax=Chishuiella changwenlii TaxID=1434701 RepID=UPI002FD9786C
MKLHLKIFILLFLSSVLSLQASNQKTITSFESTKILGTIEQVVQKINEKGVVEVKGEFYKPITSSNVKLTIKYKNDNNIWIDGWCKEFKSDEIYNKNLNAKLELPAKSSSTAYELKVEVSASQLNDLNEIYWNKSIKHYKEGAYTVEFITKPKVEIDPNKYSILLTPNTLNTLKYDSNGKLLALEDRAKTVPYHNKYYNELLLSNSNSELKNDGLNNYISVKRNADDNSDNYLVSTKDYIYQGSEYDQYVYPYHDPVFVYAGKFPSDGFQIFYARYGDFDSGSSLYDFTNPNNLTGRIFNLINSYDQKLSDIFEPGEPIVLVTSTLTGTRIYKKDGTFFHLTGHTNFNPTSIYSGFPDIYYPNGAHEERGPGNERFYFKMKKNAEFSFYGMGAIGNYAKWTGHRPLGEVEKDIQEFIDYTGIFEEKSPCESNIRITINEGEGVDVDNRDWKKAPNSYVFDPNSNSSGLLIPVKKAYKIWEEGIHMGESFVPSGNVTAEVYWEDVYGLIKSNTNYTLEIVGSGESAKIKVPVSKAKKGNAVIVYKVNGEIYWSWHVWVTDDPSNGSKYMSVDGIRRDLKNGNSEVIPLSDWGWMDRNLGAVSAGITEEGWTRNNGLLYQWGRKDPIPPLVSKGDDFYEVSGSVGRVKHRNANNNAVEGNNQIIIDDLKSYVHFSDATIKNNIQLSVKNPLSLIYVNEDNSNNPAFFNSSTPVGWFGRTTKTNFTEELIETDLWSDNSQGKIRGVRAANYDSSLEVNLYRDKSFYDPCPNGWRIPSMIVSDISNEWSYTPTIRMDFSPFGPKVNVQENYFDNIIKPTNNGFPDYLKGMKVYPGLGVDATSVNGHNIGLFPGTGVISRFEHGGVYSDQHETFLWTATIARPVDGSIPAVARSLRMTPDGFQKDIPDSSMPNVVGQYYYFPTYINGVYTSNAQGCRCIKDPLYVISDYDFPTEYFTDNTIYTSFRDGLENPNSYQIVKSSIDTSIQIPINKAFSVQSEYLNNKEILNPSNYNNLKTNVLWTTNTNLIKKIAISNNAPGSLVGINNTTINVDIHPNQSGNAVITLHNGSITNPVYWSWHIWVTNNDVETIRYVTRQPDTSAYNYVNYSKNAEVLDSEFMDRNLGAVDFFPTVGDPTAITTEELLKIKESGGLQYQWGRKDPIPSFINPDGSNYQLYLGKTRDNGTISYTELNESTYNNMQGNYIVSYDTYSTVLPTDKTSEKISKNLLYSVENPLVYMIPSRFPYYINDVIEFTKSNGADWLSQESNLGADRWGRGDKKSPFDPCPDGWRIPDVTSVKTDIHDLGLSPWQNNNAPASQGIFGYSDYYKGVNVSNYGFNFNNPEYKIGNYPFTGIRGFRHIQPFENQIKYNSNPSYSPDLAYSGIWTASLNGNYFGRAIGVLFYGGDYITPFHEFFDPFNTLNCRCVKVKTTASGLQEGAFPRMPIPFYTASIQPKEFSRKEIKSISLEEKKLKVYPNPVVDALSINGDFTEVYYYQIYDLTGRLVSKGKFINNQVNLSELRAGIYLIRINDSKELTKIIKK